MRIRFCAVTPSHVDSASAPTTHRTNPARLTRWDSRWHQRIALSVTLSIVAVVAARLRSLDDLVATAIVVLLQVSEAN